MKKFVERSLIISKNLRVNERIRVPEVRVIDENGEQAGVLKTREALALARQRNLDLVEVAPNAQPPVCRLLDYGKFRYEQTKKERDARKTQKVISIKEVRLRPKIDDHDLETKGKQARGFLEEGHKVKMTVLFRGRELAHTDIGRELLNQMGDLLKDAAVIEQPPKMEGKNMTMMLSKQASKGQSGGQSNRSENRPPRPPQPDSAASGTSNPPPAAPPAERAEA
ncbi:MAG: translation initiation factor IF-3 [Chloroflexi bacterium]|nr:translation initiation factor IF-3 [Chloroflexota bacterium]